MTHGIGTLSRYEQQSEIGKHGTAQDKANLSQATTRNRSIFTIVGDVWLDGRIWPNKVARVTSSRNLEREKVADAFKSAFRGDEDT